MEEKKQIFGLLDLQEQIGEALLARFPATCWLRAEISECKQVSAGHCYLALVEKDAKSDAVLARAQAVIWGSAWRVMRPFFESVTGRPLSSGMSVLLKVQVSYSARYGLSLTVYDIDPSFTVGELELQRQQTILRLQEEGMFDINCSLSLPLLPRRLAVVSSATAAGWRDFTRHLAERGAGFGFRIRLFPALMQGAEAPASIIAALDEIAGDADAFDAVLILRGGGAAMDLVCYDDYELAVNVAQFPIPVLTAIGHDHDYHIIDQVAHTYLKTPTALADWLADRFAGEEWRLDALLQRLHLAVRSNAVQREALIGRMSHRIANAAEHRFSSELHRIDALELKIEAADPRRALERGFLLALRNGRRASAAAQYSPGDRLSLIFRDGTVEAEVRGVQPAACNKL